MILRKEFASLLPCFVPGCEERHSLFSCGSPAVGNSVIVTSFFLRFIFDSTGFFNECPMDGDGGNNVVFCPGNTWGWEDGEKRRGMPDEGKGTMWL